MSTEIYSSDTRSMCRRHFLQLAGLTGAPSLLGSAPRSAAKPNVVFVLTDDMGYGDIGPYGVQDIRTPHLNRLAREGVRFTNSYSSGPVCTPTRAAFMTGRYQQRAALEWAIGLRDNETGLPASEISIARMLQENGYATGLFGKWHLGYRPEFGPNAHGFDEFFGHLGANVDFYSHRNIHGDPDLYENTTRVQATGYLTDLITERSVSFVQEHAHHPFFLCVTYNAPHWPFQPPDKPSDVRVPATWHNGSRRDYALMVERVDHGVGRILTELERRGLTRNTLVVFTNDNGGERLSRNTPFSNHKASLWEGGIRVPCLIRWPATLRSNQVSKQPVITMDLTATILAATGINPPRDRQLDGMDLLPILKEERPPTERAFFWRINFGGFQQKAARQASWKYIVDGPERLELLFDLERDPGERQTLAYAHPEIVARFRHQLRQWETEMDRA